MNRTDNFLCKVVKLIPLKQGQKGAKALVKLNGGDMEAYLFVEYEGKLSEKIMASVGKVVPVNGVIRNKKDIKLPLIYASAEGGANVTKIGRLTRDAELKYSQNGKVYTNFSLAVNFGWGERKETDFWECTVFGNEKETNKATVMAEQGSKGRQVAVSGRISQNKKDDKTYTNLIVDDYTFLSFPAKKDEESPTSPAAEYPDWSDIGDEIQLDDIDF